MSDPAAGWYPDPAGTPQFRWWNGATWTDALSADETAPRPVGARPDRPFAAPPQAVGRPRSSRRPGRAVLTVVVAVAIVAGLISVNSYVGHRTDSTGSAGLDPDHPTTQVSGSVATAAATSGAVNDSTRMATISSGTSHASLQLPATPYLVVPTPKALGVFDVALISNATVHPASPAQKHAWVSTVGLLHIPARTLGSGNLKTIGRQAMEDLLDQFFPRQGSRLTVESTSPGMAAGGRLSLQVKAKVSYSVPGLASRYDRIEAQVVGMDDGSCVVALSTVPNDAPADHSSAAAQSLATLQVN